jgi:hypothetical protein
MRTDEDALLSLNVNLTSDVLGSQRLVIGLPSNSASRYRRLFGDTVGTVLPDDCEMAGSPRGPEFFSDAVISNCPKRALPCNQL